jgi:GPH family glycoside/pentoside/hexuronide:cation symporter
MALSLAQKSGWGLTDMGVVALATVGFAMVAIPYGARADAITHDPRERSAMTGWRMGFASIGILVPAAIMLTATLGLLALYLPMQRHALA